jgi:hypothetical protein
MAKIEVLTGDFKRSKNQVKMSKNLQNSTFLQVPELYFEYSLLIFWKIAAVFKIQK